jgi:hypothetical protein
MPATHCYTKQLRSNRHDFQSRRMGWNCSSCYNCCNCLLDNKQGFQKVIKDCIFKL